LAHLTLTEVSGTSFFGHFFLFTLAPFALFAGVLCSLWVGEHDLIVLSAMSVCGSAGIAGALALIFADAFVWHVDALGAGLSVFASPFLGASVLGYVLMITALVLRARRRRRVTIK
jgi:hypothetical protein